MVAGVELNIVDGQIWSNNTIRSNCTFRKKEKSGLGLSSNSSKNVSEIVSCMKPRRIELFYLTNFDDFKNVFGTLKD